MSEGYIPISRKLFNHPFWTEKRVFSKAEAWIDILKNTQYEKEPQQRLIRGEVVLQEYGQAIMSTRYCGERWGWPQSRVLRFFILLENMEQITRKSTHRMNIIIVKNFALYDIRESQTESQANHRRITGESQANQSKEHKSLKEGKDITTICPEQTSGPDAPPVITLPTNKQNEYFPVAQSYVDEMQSLYPSVDVMQELKKIRAWLLSNPKKRKTSGGMKRFINSWLSKEQDKGGSGQKTSVPKPITYAQCQDAERRNRALRLIKQMEEKENGNTGSDTNGVGQTRNLLP